MAKRFMQSKTISSFFVWNFVACVQWFFAVVVVFVVHVVNEAIAVIQCHFTVDNLLILLKSMVCEMKNRDQH